jgi:hypothetical protein
VRIPLIRGKKDPPCSEQDPARSFQTVLDD